MRQFYQGDKIDIVDYGFGEHMIPGIIVETRGPFSYIIQTSDGRFMHLYQDQIRRYYDTPEYDVQTDIPVTEEFTQNKSSQDPMPVSDVSQPSSVRVPEDLLENVPEMSCENIQDSTDTMNDPSSLKPV